MTQATDDGLLTTMQAARRLGIGRRMLYYLIEAGEIETIRMPSRTGRDGGQHRIEPAEIQRFIDRNRQRATA